MHDRISIDPNICHGQACIKGTRIPVHQIVLMLANGDTIPELLRACPTLDRRSFCQTFSWFFTCESLRETSLAWN